MELQEIIGNRLLPVGGGKGGVGKSAVAAAVGLILAQQGKKVVFIDADLGGANLHTCLGIRYPPYGLGDFLYSKVTFEQIQLDTIEPNAKLISGASDILGLANPTFTQKQKIIRAMQKLNADYIVIDLGAGTNYNTIDFFSISNKGIIVIDSEPTTIENAYGFLKTCILRKIKQIYSDDKVNELIQKTSNPRVEGKIGTIPELMLQLPAFTNDRGAAAQQWYNGFVPRLIINRVINKEDIDVGGRFCDIAKKYLGINVVYIGYVVEDPTVHASIKHVQPLTVTNENCRALECLRVITANIEQLEKIGG